VKNLVQIQNELKVPKGNFNSFGKYRYRSAEDILEALKPILLKYEMTLTITDDLVLLGDKIFLKATAVLEKDGVGSCEVSGFAETSEHKGMSAEQTTGTASSYARKYALNGLFLIDETEADADAPAAARDKGQQPVNSQIPMIDRIRKAENAIRALGGEVSTFNPISSTSPDDMKAELEALTEQFNRLKKANS
jgi:hypothetical protein